MLLRFFAPLLMCLLAACGTPPEEPPLPTIEQLEQNGQGLIVVKAFRSGGSLAPLKPLNVIVAQRNGESRYNIGYQLQHVYSSFKGPRVIKVDAGSYFLALVLDGTDPNPRAFKYEPVGLSSNADAIEAFTVMPGEVVNLGDVMFAAGRKISFETFEMRVNVQESAPAARAALAKRRPEAVGRMVYRPFRHR